MSPKETTCWNQAKVSLWHSTRFYKHVARVKFLWNDTSFPSLKLPVLRVPQMNQCILSYTFSFAILSVGAPIATTCPWTICEFFPTICPCIWDGSFFEAFEGFGPLGLPDTDRVDRTCWAGGSMADSGCTMMLRFSFLKPAKPPPQTTHKSTPTIATIASECWQKNAKKHFERKR